MNESYLKELIGLTITNIHMDIDHTIPIRGKEEDQLEDLLSAYVQIFFGSYILNIYNPFEIIPGGGKVLNELTGLKVIEAMETKDEATFLFDDGKKLRVNLRDEAYTGPEAMCLTSPDGSFAVWN